MNERVLLVEDEPGLVMTLTDRLTEEGYVVETAQEGNAALQRATEKTFELIILDVMLPRTSGFDVCRELRHRGVNAPVLMLTARSQIVDKVVGLKLGADDYMTKPFAMIELLARMEALLRRAGRATTSKAGSFEFGSVRIDFRSTQVFKDGKLVELSAREFNLLKFFIDRRGQTLTRDELLNEVWGYDAMPITRTVDVHVAWLRQKIEHNPRHPRHLLTVHGIGYRFVVENE